jgi:hypothetical protein
MVGLNGAGCIGSGLIERLRADIRNGFFFGNKVFVFTTLLVRPHTVPSIIYSERLMQLVLKESHCGTNQERIITTEKFSGICGQK